MKRNPIILKAIAVVFLGAFICVGKGASRNGVFQTFTISAEGRAAILAISDDLKELQKNHENYVKAAAELDGLYAKLSDQAQAVARLASEIEKSQNDKMNALLKAIQKMEEMQQGLKAIHHDSQSKMTEEDRKFAMVSKIIKDRHDTSKNAIANIR